MTPGDLVTIHIANLGLVPLWRCRNDWRAETNGTVKHGDLALLLELDTRPDSRQHLHLCLISGRLGHVHAAFLRPT